MTRSTGAFSMIGLVVLIVAGSLAGQTLLTPTPGQQEKITTTHLYSYFFHCVHAVEALAQHSEAAGTDPQHLTRKLMLQNDTQLTDSEFEAVRAIALDHNAKRDAAFQQWKNATDNFKSTNGANANPFSSPDLRKQQADLSKFLLQNTLDHVDQIKAALGDARFQQFDQWVRTKAKPKPSTSPALGPS